MHDGLIGFPSWTVGRLSTVEKINGFTKSMKNVIVVIVYLQTSKIKCLFHLKFDLSLSKEYRTFNDYIYYN
jgi:hypothetical protein